MLRPKLTDDHFVCAIVKRNGVVHDSSTVANERPLINALF